MLPAVPLFVPMLTGPKLGGSSKYCSKSIDCIGEETLVHCSFIFKCLYFVQPIKFLLSNSEYIEYYK